MINRAVKLTRVKAIRRGGRKATREARDEEALQEVAGLWDKDELFTDPNGKK